MKGCFYCGFPMLRRGKRGRRSKSGKTFDHKTPKSRGGNDDPTNIVGCHARCNVDKGDRTLEEYRAIVAARKGVPVETFKFPGEEIR